MESNEFVEVFAGLCELLHTTDVDVSVEDECVVIPAESALALVRRQRSRDVLVGELTSLLYGIAPGDDVALRENLAERIIDRLGVALLVERDVPRQTARIKTGEREELTVEELYAREGRRLPARLHDPDEAQAVADAMREGEQ